MSKKQNIGLAAAIKAIGSQQKLADELTKLGRPTRQAMISYWLLETKYGTPAEWVLDIERVTGVSRHVIRPDIYPLEMAEAAQ